MNRSMTHQQRSDLLTTLDRPSPVKAGLLTAREKGPRIVRAAMSRSGLLLKEITDKDHGQASRECDGKEKLDFHEMVATWPAAVWVELLPLIALAVCPGQFTVERTIAIKEISTLLREKGA